MIKSTKYINIDIKDEYGQHYYVRSWDSEHHAIVYINGHRYRSTKPLKHSER